VFAGGPGQDQIVGNSLTASGTLVTVPAGNSLTANIQLSAAVAVAGTSSPVVTVQGTNAAPASGTVIARLNVSGLLASAAADSGEFEILVKAPPENSITLQFTAGASGASSATINGWIFT
jgi:hypothetical protein